MIEKLLNRYDLRSTHIRREVLRLFLGCDHALTHHRIEQEVQGEFDRVTLYRTLRTFEEKGLLHRVLNDQDTIQYALCKDEHCQTHQHKHVDNHVHFQCEQCARTFCMDDVPIPLVDIPENYKVRSMQLLVMGICDECGVNN